jgi:BRI3-like protein
MSLVTCPKCNAPVNRSGYPVWVIIVAICFFPLGLLALLAGREPSRCHQCGNVWQA